MSIKILIVEDDSSIMTGLVDLLESEGYQVFSAEDGCTALKKYNDNHPDLILLDIMIPEISGYDVCRKIRAMDKHTPILMLTAKGQEIEKVIGLEIGADDYIVKPFGVNELLARIRAALRRSQNGNTEEYANFCDISFGDVKIDARRYEGNNGENQFCLSQKEMQLIQLFYSHEGEVLNRFTLLDKIWGVKYEGTTRTLDQHVVKLRQKVEKDPGHPKHIVTIHGVGYRFEK